MSYITAKHSTIGQHHILTIESVRELVADCHIVQHVLQISITLVYRAHRESFYNMRFTTRQCLQWAYNSLFTAERTASGVPILKAYSIWDFLPGILRIL